MSILFPGKVTWHFCVTVFGPLYPEHCGFCSVFSCILRGLAFSHELFRLLQLLSICCWTFPCGAWSRFSESLYPLLKIAFFIESWGKERECVCLCTPWCTCGSQRTTFENWFSPLCGWKPRFSGLEQVSWTNKPWLTPCPISFFIVLWFSWLHVFLIFKTMLLIACQY